MRGEGVLTFIIDLSHRLGSLYLFIIYLYFFQVATWVASRCFCYEFQADTQVSLGQIEQPDGSIIYIWYTILI